MSTPNVTSLAAVRLGWCLAEVRGRNWFHGPRPQSTPLPPVPDGVLPLRSQRSTEASRYEAVHALIAVAKDVAFEGADEFVTRLQAVLPAFDTGGAQLRADPTTVEAEAHWATIHKFFFESDARIQDALTRRDDLLANAYLLGRGLAECYWGLGPEAEWAADGADTAVSPAFLLGPDRRRELARMLGRVGPQLSNAMTASAVSGSLEAWGAVAADPQWSRSPELPDILYEQIRRWYQLIVLGQDPTTLLRPYSRLTLSRNLTRVIHAFWPQILTAAVGIGLVTAFFAVTRGSAPDWVKSLLATGGIGTFAAAGLIVRAKNAAQQLALRLRQDAYTDLVAVDVTVVPPYPHPTGRPGRVAVGQRRLEYAVRQRLLTPPTPPPDQRVRSPS